LTEAQNKPDIASLIADIAREECRRLCEKRLAGLEDELAAIYKRFDWLELTATTLLHDHT
jgi:hypothetical protein